MKEAMLMEAEIGRTESLFPSSSEAEDKAGSQAV